MGITTLEHGPAAPAGRRYMGAQLAERMARMLDLPPSVQPHHRLTGREIDVLRRIAQGESVAYIVGVMGLSPKTVSTYKTRLCVKLALKTPSDVIRYAVANEIVRPE
ncbi:response regulator transcription factor [Burkholderia pyrrocinia]|uniref:response regulator transcription factor n=1 Tax=Burkholderia pyrrocinia TaxID=60550 RepID=UPI00158B9263|nr:LuxR C-terminal-related transcriptional regulator [Burkholderia pyrrocinia]